MLHAFIFAVAVRLPTAPAPSPTPFTATVSGTINVPPERPPCPAFSPGIALPAPAATPTAAAWTCDTFVAATVPFIHSQSLGAPAMRAAPLGLLHLGQYDASLALAKDAEVHASGLDRTPGVFAGALSSLGQNATVPASVLPSNWFMCALCQAITGQAENYATQTGLQVPGSPGVPTSGLVFETAVDLSNLSPADLSANLGINIGDSGKRQNSFLFGYARGYTTTGAAFNDGYFVYTMPSKDTVVASLAYANANHAPAPSPTSGPATHTSVTIATVNSAPARRLDTATDDRTQLAIKYPGTLQLGTQAQAGGGNLSVVQQYQLTRTAANTNNPWDLLTPGRAGDVTASAFYLDRGANFLPPDSASSDALQGEHGFAGTLNLYPTSPFHDRTAPSAQSSWQPMNLQLSGFRFGDSSARYTNLNARLAVPFGNHFQAIANVSRGQIAASATSQSYASSPLPDSAGGAALLPQATVEFDVGYANGWYYKESLSFPDFTWGVQAGFANQGVAQCNGSLTGFPCYATRHKQITFGGFVDSAVGFLSISAGPGVLASSPNIVSTNPNALTPRQFGSFLNKTSYNVQGGVHVPQWMPNVCNTVFLSASNTAPPPELTTATPSSGVSMSAFVELVPLDPAVPVAFFAGVSHTISNTAQSTFGTPASFSSQFVSTVTYSFKLSIGTEGYRYNLRNACTFKKPS